MGRNGPVRCWCLQWNASTHSCLRAGDLRVSEKETYSGVCFKVHVTMFLGVKAFRVHRTKWEKQSGTELSITSEEVVWSFTLDLKVATFGCGHSFKA